jgi:hypothetical protein
LLSLTSIKEVGYDASYRQFISQWRVRYEELLAADHRCLLNMLASFVLLVASAFIAASALPLGE